jgi:peptidyl-prolyl cis-trans isomerase-like protein 2
MGKRQGEKIYVTAKEWATEGGGKAANSRPTRTFKPLPYYCCGLSLQPFETPVTTYPEGTVFDILNIMPYIKKFGKHPGTGRPLTAKDLIRLTFHKNAQDEYMCPITYKAFTDHSHIVFIRTSGQVYSMEAVEQMNIKIKSWNDLITGDPFTRKDIVSIQDPNDMQKRNISEFHYVKQGLSLKDEEEEDPTKNINAVGTTQKVLQELASKGKKAEEATPAQKKRKTVPTPAAAATTTAPPKPAPAPEPKKSGASSAFFTCAGFAEKATEDDIPIKKTKKKGYVRFHTNLGDLNIELHCDLTPLMCENFLLLADRGFYNNTTFHRLIPGFMIQGGDPTATGTGGKSAWGKPLKDEIVHSLRHTARGVLSMANAGPNTNTSQFFILFKPATHLDNKHSVFGRVVGGMEVLDLMETVPTDPKDKPRNDIVIKKVSIFVNPFDSELLEEEMKQEAEEEVKKAKEKADMEEFGSWYTNPTGDSKQAVYRQGVGKYIHTSTLAVPSAGRGLGLPPPSAAGASTPAAPATGGVGLSLPQAGAKRKSADGKFGDFSQW